MNVPQSAFRTYPYCTVYRDTSTVVMSKLVLIRGTMKWKW